MRCWNIKLWSRNKIIKYTVLNFWTYLTSDTDVCGTTLLQKYSIDLMGISCPISRTFGRIESNRDPRLWIDCLEAPRSGLHPENST